MTCYNCESESDIALSTIVGTRNCTNMSEWLARFYKSRDGKIKYFILFIIYKTISNNVLSSSKFISWIYYIWKMNIKIIWRWNIPINLYFYNVRNSKYINFIAFFTIAPIRFTLFTINIAIITDKSFKIVLRELKYYIIVNIISGYPCLKSEIVIRISKDVVITFKFYRNWINLWRSLKDSCRRRNIRCWIILESSNSSIIFINDFNSNLNLSLNTYW